MLMNLKSCDWSRHGSVPTRLVFLVVLSHRRALPTHSVAGRYGQSQSWLRECCGIQTERRLEERISRGRVSVMNVRLARRYEQGSFVLLPFHLPLLKLFVPRCLLSLLWKNRRETTILRSANADDNGASGMALWEEIDPQLVV